MKTENDPNLMDSVAEAIKNSSAKSTLKRFAHHYDCATPEQYELWVRAVRTAQHISGVEAEPDVPKEARTTPVPPIWFCTDCTPEYQARMIEEKKCRHPEVAFRVEGDGFMEGYLPKEQRKLDYQAQRVLRAKLGRDQSG